MKGVFENLILRQILINIIVCGLGKNMLYILLKVTSNNKNIWTLVKLHDNYSFGVDVAKHLAW